MLGYLSEEGRGRSDELLRSTALRLQAKGVKLAGAVQENVDRDPPNKCDMDLHVLSGTSVIRISQRLGPLARGCRLDPAGLEEAVGLVAASLEQRPALLVINKFGKQELDGRGFCPLIGTAISEGIPVLTAVNPANLEGFLAFADGMAEHLPFEQDAIIAWSLSHVPDASVRTPEP